MQQDKMTMSKVQHPDKRRATPVRVDWFLPATLENNKDYYLWMATSIKFLNLYIKKIFF